MHIMFDLETLGTRVDTVIVQAAHALFNLPGDGTSPGSGDPVGDSDPIISSRSFNLNVPHQMYVLKRHVDWSTIVWWMGQGDEARQALVSIKDTVTLEEYLREIITTVDWPKIEGVWSHGLTFDVPILEHAFKTFARTVPWGYRKPRDTRTLFWLADYSPEEVKTVAHVARDDAIYAAKNVARAYRKLTQTRVVP